MARVAVVQMRSSEDKADNLDRIRSWIARAARRGASLVAFPEFAMAYAPPSAGARELAAAAEGLRGPFVSGVRAAAREARAEVVCTMYERAPGGRRVYDTAFLVGRGGELRSSYRKLHLYDALGARESARMAPGSRAPEPAASSAGRVGMVICYDLRFPELGRGLAASGSQVIAAPSAWVRGPMKEEHWVTLNRARAIENGCYMVSPDQAGHEYCGRSLVVDPYGRVLLDMGRREGVGYAEVSPSAVRETRRSLPLLRSRRTDVYPDLGGPARRAPRARALPRPGLPARVPEHHDGPAALGAGPPQRAHPGPLQQRRRRRAAAGVVGAAEEALARPPRPDHDDLADAALGAPGQPGHRRAGAEHDVLSLGRRPRHVAAGVERLGDLPPERGRGAGRGPHRVARGRGCPPPARRRRRHAAAGRRGYLSAGPRRRAG